MLPLILVENSLYLLKSNLFIKCLETYGPNIFCFLKLILHFTLEVVLSCFIHLYEFDKLTIQFYIVLFIYSSQIFILPQYSK